MIILIIIIITTIVINIDSVSAQVMRARQISPLGTPLLHLPIEQDSFHHHDHHDHHFDYNDRDVHDDHDDDWGLD